MNWPFGTVLRDPDTGGMVMVCGPWNGNNFAGIVVGQPDDDDYAEWPETGEVESFWLIDYEWERMDDAGH